MTLDLLRDEIWRGLGEPTDLDPDSDTTYNGGPLLTYVCNEAQRQIAMYKDPTTNRRVRFRNLIAELFFKAKVIQGATAPTGTVATSTSIKLSSTYIGLQADRYNGWVISTGSDVRLLVDGASTSGVYSATIHQSWGTVPSNSASYSLYKDFYYLLSNGDSWLTNPAGEHIQLPTTNSVATRPEGNFLDILRVEDMENQRQIPRAPRTAEWAGNFVSPGDPQEWRRNGKKLQFNTPGNAEHWYRLTYYRLPTEMRQSQASDKPEIPEMFHYGIVLWGLWWGCRRNRESGAAYSAKKDFEDFMRNTMDNYEIANEFQNISGKLRRRDYNYVFGGN